MFNLLEHLRNHMWGRGAGGVRTVARLEVRQPEIKKLGTERQKERIEETRRRLRMSTELDINWTTHVKQKQSVGRTSAGRRGRR